MQVERGGFGLTMAKHPWLDDLRRLSIVFDPLFCVPVHDWVFNGSARDWSIPERGEKRRSLIQFGP
jgi:hypothetical protein